MAHPSDINLKRLILFSSQHPPYSHLNQGIVKSFKTYYRKAVIGNVIDLALLFSVKCSVKKIYIRILYLRKVKHWMIITS